MLKLLMLLNYIAEMEAIMAIKTYSELSKLKTFEERFEYLKLNGAVGSDTFGWDRYLNQILYKSSEWRSIRNMIIVRDNGCDLGVEGHEIFGNIIIHHMNPIRVEDITNRNPDILNPEYLICVSHSTHNAIHYGDDNQLYSGPIKRTVNDTCPWRK